MSRFLTLHIHQLLAAQLAPEPRGRRTFVYPTQEARGPEAEEPGYLHHLKFPGTPSSLFNVFLSLAYTVVTHKLHNVFQKRSRSFCHPRYLYCCVFEFDFSKYIHRIPYECTQLTIKAPAIKTPLTTLPPSRTIKPEAANCCFVIQETVTEEWWPVESVTYTTLEVNLTSITTLVTPYPNATSTNVVTNVYLTNASFPVTQTLGNPIPNYPNNAFEMPETDYQLNGTATVTAGVTMYDLLR